MPKRKIGIQHTNEEIEKIRKEIEDNDNKPFIIETICIQNIIEKTGYCQECKEHKTKLCNEKLIFQNIKQVSNVRWHLYFSCSQKHKVIRWVIIDHNSVVIGNTKN